MHRNATQLRYSATTAAGTTSQHWIDAGIAEPDGTVSIHSNSSITNAQHTQLQLLINAVHERLQYDGVHSPVSLELALQDGLGDCTEFATLFSRFAGEAGFKNRIRTGLAYFGDAVQALGHHQWNEVYIDGNWVAVDPTWQQIPADVTHLPLPQSGDAGLAAYAALPDLYLKVIN